jgi:DNA-binding GntR family transcriptional regulator
MATEWAAAAIAPADLRHLDELIAIMDAAKAVKDRARYVPANRDFHFTIYKAAGSPALMAIIESLWLQIGPYINLLKETENWSRSNEDHKAIRDALRSGDRVAARAALHEDITEAAKALESVLKR